MAFFHSIYYYRDDFPVRIWRKTLPKKDTSPRTVDMRRSKTSHAKAVSNADCILLRQNCEFIRLWLKKGLVVRPLCLFTSLPNETHVSLGVITTRKLLTNRAYESESGLNVFSFVVLFADILKQPVLSHLECKTVQ